ncbi:MULTISPECIES: acyl-CoA dehydrogenase family protein [Halomicrobium]|uniref:glutaryl-CoA dehydrogenase (ETF) n=2 Tax=Halomicrobium mukohataei TaxID=57705 RepID=C7P217_HALMD|nr:MULTISPECIES: acyl-CoA dehydrogenase family protein [Halomicrobium]ACV47246.1 acyl-CoA dehydrogenase domain protein [Halomicrobium mukohataei DSM 12286]QCD65719.1 acyl-CoA dehydrogenase [Halomicrobium mukohataei]QFR20525.1 acyl-CoA dehydrogenase [Halomicrobium sp. ZPS1]
MLDYLDLESDLDGEERMIRDTAREFVDEHVRPEIGEWFESGTSPDHLFEAMGELDFFAPTLSWGTLPGVSPRSYGLLMQELEAGDSGVRSMASVQGALVMYPIHEFGSEAQRERWLPDLAAGDAVGCFGLTEPEHGSDPASMETTAVPDGDGYRLSGTKTWITNAPIADVAVIWCKIDDGDAETDDPVRGVLVDLDSEGVSEEQGETEPRQTDRSGGVETSEIDGKLSMRASSTGEIHLRDAWVPEDALLPGVEGMKGPLSCLTEARYGIAWGAVGAARDCFEAAREYATDREQFGGPIARFQLQQEKLAEMATRITTAQLLADRLATLKARGDLRPQQVSMAKRNNVRMAREVAQTAREMLGGNGITTDYPPMRHAANMETVYTYEGTHDIHTLILGADLTGIDAFE